MSGTTTSLITALLPITEGSLGLLPRALEALAREGVAVRVLDRTEAGVLAREGGALHTPQVARGEVWRAALAEVETPYIAMVDPMVFPMPGRFTRAVEALEEGFALVTTDLALRGGDGAGVEVVNPVGTTPLPYWWGTVAMRREVLEQMERTAFFPVELALYQRLRRLGRVGHLGVALSEVSAGAFRALRARAALDLRLVAHAERPAPAVEFSALLPYEEAGVVEVLESWMRQDLPAGRCELLVIDPRGEGARRFAGTLWPIPVAFVSDTREALGRARGAHLLVVPAGAVASPELVGRHRHAHLAEPHTVQVGGVRANLGGAALARVLRGERAEEDAPLKGGHYSLERGLLGEGERLEGRWAHLDLGHRLTESGALFRRIHEEVSCYFPITVARLAEESRGRAGAAVELALRYPGARAASGRPVALRVEEIEGVCVQKAAAMEVARAALEALAPLDLDLLERQGEPFAASARAIEERVRAMISFLSPLWGLEGFAEGLRGQGVHSLAEALAAQPARIIGGEAPFTLLIPPAERLDWVEAVERWAAEGRPGTLLVRAHPVMGCPEGRVRAVLAGVSGRYPQTKLAILRDTLAASEEARLFGVVGALLEVEGTHRRRHRTLAERADIEVIAPMMGAPPHADRPYRYYAWPQWEEEALAALLAAARPLANRPEVLLYLRHDPALDPPVEIALTALESAWNQVFSADDALEVQIDGPGEGESVVGKAAGALSARGPERALPYLAEARAVEAHLAEMSNFQPVICSMEFAK